MDFHRLKQKDVAQAFGKSARTIQTWSDEGMPRNADDSYDLPVCIEWRERGTVGDLDPAQESARKNAAIADKTEMEIAVRAGELMAISEAVAWYAEHIGRCKSRLMQVADAVGQFCDARTAAIVVAQVRRLIYEAMAELAADRPRMDKADFRGMAATADSDGESVGGSEPAIVERVERGTGAVADQ